MKLIELIVRNWENEKLEIRSANLGLGARKSLALGLGGSRSTAQEEADMTRATSQIDRDAPIAPPEKQQFLKLGHFALPPHF